MNINEWTKQIHELAISKGWWEPDADGRVRSFGELIALCHSELSEALEHYRDGSYPVMMSPVSSKECGPQKPDGWAVELVDCLIRVLDMLAHYEIDVEAVMKIKHEFNKTRPYRHGNKVL